MTGYPDYNYPLFREVEQALFKYGIDGVRDSLEVCNPANNFGGDQTRPRQDYIDLALKQVGEADALVLLPGWGYSEGAKLEVAEAQRTGKRFYLASNPGDGWTFVPSLPVRQEFETRDSGQREQWSTGMQRDTSQGKTRFDLLMPYDLPYDRQMIVRFAELMTRGAVKYDARNWEQASTTAEMQRFRESAIRHFFQWYLAADDVEDHAAAVFFNIMGAEYTRDRINR